MSTGPVTASKPLPEQLQAADPRQSVWVSAAAGTGKTRVLVDRLLRLLLRGVQPSRILCITFTKAAAGQIEDRIRQNVTQWVIASDADLDSELYSILGETPNNQTRAMARRLFHVLLDSERPLAIQTIHGFCQSVLARFPLEAGLLPGFSIASDRQAATLQLQAFQQTLVSAQNNPIQRRAVEHLFGITDRERILSLLTTLQRHGNDWIEENEQDFLPRLHQALNLPYPLGKDTLRNQFYAATLTKRPALQNLIADLMAPKSGATATNFAQSLATFLETADARSSEALDTYINSVFTKTTGTVQSNVLKLALKVGPTLGDELDRIALYRSTEDTLDLIARNHSLLILARAYAAHYQALKNSRALLDYNDQIQLTANLLSVEGQASWVMYKLDYGIQHILVDEAQDTSPDQWRIILALTEEIRAGSGRFETGDRSVFIVGDEKQSIYSFQDADIASYQTTRQALHQSFTENDVPWQDIALTRNFRSSPAILSVVDGIFADPALQRAITREAAVTHIPHHAGRSGLVEVWPRFAAENAEADDDYLPTTVIQERKATALLCQTIATTIRDWLDTQRVIPRLGRAIRAGDILILLQQRHPLLAPLIKALKDKRIPVSGVDRMILTEQLIVKDLLALLQIMLLPQDDLTLAAVLKSPLIGLSEQHLFDLAYGRDAMPLWDRLLNNADIDPSIAEYLRDLRTFYEQGAGPYQLLSRIVNHPCPTDRKSGRHALITRLGFDAQDALDELLNLAMQFEQDDASDIQLFLHMLRRNDAEIKRDVSGTQHDMVRIMTVHGAKGLQAPVVFLADASAQKSMFDSRKNMLWHDDLPFWTTKPTEQSALHNAYLAHVKDAMDEYYRLLYVALTRAEDELYITGWQDTRSKGDAGTDWHAIAQRYLQANGETIEQPDGTQLYRHIFAGSEDRRNTDDELTPVIPAMTPNDLPWLWQNPPPALQDRPRPLRPSRPPHMDPVTLSPLQQPSTGRFARGIAIHKILQHIVSYAPEQQAAALSAMLDHPELSVPPQDRDRLFTEISTLIAKPDTQFIFASLPGDTASSELSIAGSIYYNGSEYALTGMIDRLVNHNGALWIIDYKTNRPPAQSLNDVPDAYLFQMAAYRALLQNMYPGISIHAALVWTHNATVMELPADRLEQVIPSSPGNRPA